jgi:ribosomal protein L37AE/L43A
MAWGKWLRYSNRPCPSCGRYRLELYENGKSCCEKCDWSPEEGRYVEYEEIFEQEVNNYYG